MRTMSNTSKLIIAVAVAADVLVWHQIILAGPPARSELHFLNVGQGDSELVVFPGNVKVLTDAGPDRSVLGELQKILPAEDRYIDLAVISHPQLDHFNGFNDVLDRYQIGAVITNGRDDAPTVGEWPVLLEKIKKGGVPLIIAGEGDSIRYRDNAIRILSPGRAFIESAELNDTGIVELVTTNFFTALLTADIGASVENSLVERFGTGRLRADVLKVAHHGSKYSSSDAFLKAVLPHVAVIEVGAKNRYGHPSLPALERLVNDTTARIFRTDQDGTISVRPTGQALSIFGSPRRTGAQ